MKDDELILQPPSTTRKKATKKSPEDKLKSPSVSVRLEARFQIAFARRYGFPVILSEGRDRALLNKMVEQWGEGDEATGEAAVGRTMDEFFAATMPGGRGYHEIKRLRWHNIPDFFNGAQILRRLNGSGPVGDLHERTSSNVHEVMKAMGKKP